MRGQFLSVYRGGDFHTEGLEDAWLEYVFSGQSPEYSAADVENTVKGISFSKQTIGIEVLQSGFDLFEDFRRLPRGALRLFGTTRPLAWMHVNC